MASRSQARATANKGAKSSWKRQGFLRLDRAQPANCRTAEYEFVNPFITFILSRNRVAKNGLFANLAFAADDVLVSG